jgi:hypothetical protein
VAKASTDYTSHIKAAAGKCSQNCNAGDVRGIALERMSDVIQTIEIANKRAKTVDPSARSVGAKKRARDYMKAACTESVIELINEAGDIVFLMTKLVHFPTLFTLSLTVLAVSLAARLGTFLMLRSHIDKKKWNRYVFGMAVGLVEPNSGMRLIEGTLKQKEKGGKRVWDAPTQKWVAANEEEVVTQARIAYTINHAKIRTLVATIITEDVFEFIVELMYLGYAQGEELYSTVFLVSVLGTVLHMLVQLDEIHFISQTLNELQVIIETREKTFTENAGDDDVAAFLLINSGKKVRSINLEHCDNITDEALKHIAQHCPILRSLDLRDCKNVTDKGLTVLATQCHSMTHLVLDRCCVTDAGVVVLAQHCGAMVCLDLKDCTGVTDVGVAALAKGCNALVSVNLMRCTGVTDKGIKILAEHCRSMTTLVLAECGGVTDEGVMALAHYCRAMTYLHLNMCVRVMDKTLKALSRYCPVMSHLHLRGCSGVTDKGLEALAEGCHGITTLNLHGCRSITDIGVKALADQSRSLAFVGLALCKGVTDDGVQALAQQCGKSITSLYLSYCPSITDNSCNAIAEHCHAMVNLQLECCRHITDMGVWVLVEKLGPATGGPDFLTTLLSGPDFTHGSLTTLGLGQCLKVTKAFQRELSGEDMSRFLQEVVLPETAGKRIHRKKSNSVHSTHVTSDVLVNITQSIRGLLHSQSPVSSTRLLHRHQDRHPQEHQNTNTQFEQREQQDGHHRSEVSAPPHQPPSIQEGIICTGSRFFV